ncbi:hypothetical protein SRHO_G00215510 [Serrasalmus rhombeus]
MWNLEMTIQPGKNAFKRRNLPHFDTSDSLHPISPSTVSFAREHPASLVTWPQMGANQKARLPRLVVQWLMLAGLLPAQSTAAFPELN